MYFGPRHPAHGRCRLVRPDIDCVSRQESSSCALLVEGRSRQCASACMCASGLQPGQPEMGDGGFQGSTRSVWSENTYFNQCSAVVDKPVRSLIAARAARGHRQLIAWTPRCSMEQVASAHPLDLEEMKEMRNRYSGQAFAERALSTTDRVSFCSHSIISTLQLIATNASLSSYPCAPRLQAQSRVAQRQMSCDRTQRAPCVSSHTTMQAAFCRDTGPRHDG